MDSSCLSYRKAALRACSLDPSLRLLLSLLFCPSRASLMFLYQFLSFSSFSFPVSSSLVWRSHLLQSSCALRSTPQHSCDVPWMLSYHVPKAAHASHKCASGNALSLSQRRYYFCPPLSSIQLAFLLYSAVQAVGRLRKSTKFESPVEH